MVVFYSLGNISITLDTFYYEPYNNTPSDIAAADRAMQFSVSVTQFASPKKN